MFRSLPIVVASAAFLTLGAAAPASAQELVAASITTSSVLFPVAPIVAAPVVVPVAAAAVEAAEAEAQRPIFDRAVAAPRNSRPLMLPVLYASQIALQALDAHSTYSAMNRGAVEANPLMKGVVKNKGAMMAVKAGVAAGTIYMAERMWKRGNRLGAIATMLVVNGVTAAVVANNYKVASGLR